MLPATFSHEVPALDQQGIRQMMAQYNKAISEPSKTFMFLMTENLNRWYVKITMDEGELAGGEYLVELIAPRDFPHSPPSFYFVTPNGIYEVGKKVCISIGEYHKDKSRDILGMAGFVRELWNGMINWRDLGGGINIIAGKGGPEQITAAAAGSRAYNAAHLPGILEAINAAYGSYSAKWVAEYGRLARKYEQIVKPLQEQYSAEPRKLEAQMRKLEREKDAEKRWEGSDYARMAEFREVLTQLKMI